MRLPLFSLLLGLTASSLIAEEVVVLGDSLSFAYEAEFCFQVVHPFLGTFGDNMPAHVRNWAETLGTSRAVSFDQGTRQTLTFTFPSFPSPIVRNLFFRNTHNWAIPGLEIDQLRRMVVDHVGFLELIGETEGFETLETAFGYSNFNANTHFNLTQLDSQISSSAERLVLFIGGNDVRNVYGPVYNTNTVGTFVDDFIADANAILDRIRVLNANIPIVVVAVPHIGITPDIKADFAPDPVKTPRVTAMLRDLNARLETAAKQHGAAFADIFTPTLSLLEATPYCIHGITFSNTGSANGDLGFVWLNGPMSANFHPNTSAQLVIANEIIRTFNRRYNNGIAPLTATEMLTLLGKAAQVDMTFANWMTGFGLTGGTDVSDVDGDRIPAGVEFALGLNPTLRDADQVTTSIVPITGGFALQMAFPKRLPTSPNFTLQATTSTNPATPFVAVAPAPVLGSDGLYRAQVPVTPGGRAFMRLQGTVTP